MQEAETAARNALSRSREFTEQRPGAHMTARQFVPRLLSIVTPTYNSRRFIEELAQSVLKLQVGKEWILVDNCSTDGTYEFILDLARRYPFIRPIQQPETVPYWTSYADGVHLAAGEFLLMVDSDDILVPAAASRAVAFLLEHQDIDVIIGKVRYITEAGIPYKVKRIPFARYGTVMSGRRLLWTVFLSPTYPVKQGGILYRFALLEKTGVTFDIDLLLLATRYTRVALLPEVLLQYRNVASGMSSSQRWRMDAFWGNLAAEHFPRERYGGLRHVLALYKRSLGWCKWIYSRFTPNRI